jgi:hypothetical protein
MPYKLTVLCPGIRTANWERLYNSIGDAFKGTWEIIFIGPYELPDALKNVKKKNVKLITDWGSPIRCQQRGLTEAQGDYVTWAADDGVFLPESLDVAFKKVEGKDYKTVVMGKYTEGSGNTTPMLGDFYYYLNNHDSCKLPYMPEKCLMLNVGIVSRQLLVELGGWDCQFEVCPMAYNDLAVRLNRYGAEILIQDELMFKCSHTPGHEGDHGPIHDGQIWHDHPVFTLIYADKHKSQRTAIDIDNWKNAPEKWERRFGV